MSNVHHIFLKSDDDREDVFVDLVDTLLDLNDAQRKQVAEAAGIHWTTVYNWMRGATTRPRIDTLARVARALGYEIVLRRATRQARAK